MQFSFFFPTIAQALGYGTTTTLLLTAPPWIWAMVVSLPNAWHADRTGERFFHYFGPALSCLVGYIIAMTTTTTAPRYVSMFLMTSKSLLLPLLNLGGERQLKIRNQCSSWICLWLCSTRLDLKHHSPSTGQASGCHCLDQRARQHREYSGLIHLPGQLRTILCEIIRCRSCYSRDRLYLRVRFADVPTTSQQEA